MRFFQYRTFPMLFIVFLSTLTLNSCKKGYGCPTEDYHADLDKKGNPKKKAKSGLWDNKNRMNSGGNPKKSDKRKPKKNKTN